MKSIVFFSSLLALSFSLINCEDNTEELNPDDLTGPIETTSIDINETPGLPEVEAIPVNNQNPTNTDTEVRFTPLFEATIDGRQTTLTNLFRDGEAINSFFNRNAVYIEVYVNGNPNESVIVFSINRNDVAEGTYDLGENSVFSELTHLNYNVTSPLNATTEENTTSGRLTITNLDTTNLIMQGTFEFTAKQSNRATGEFIRNIEIEEGRFSLKYKEAQPDPNENP